MKQVKNYKQNLKAAVGSTVCIVMLLLVTANNSAKGDSLGVFMVVMLVGLLMSTILLWIKGTRQYIDQRFQEIEKTDLSEKIKEE